ncbi:hypothetical protein AVEN_226743-1 [Araneus ventricosus]|uniref:Uncharacterized protein n=1 Tax=Araneus ventricosus TaxID=182803 RepID=A0A4Y2K2U6_ARAVE|nr:hypothetical protein AVEN_226743-1 [Araneus ventricosus]
MYVRLSVCEHDDEKTQQDRWMKLYSYGIITRLVDLCRILDQIHQMVDYSNGYENRQWMYNESSPTKRIMENDALITNIPETHEAQVTALVQIRNTSRQKITYNNSNRTFNSIYQITSSHCEQKSKEIPQTHSLVSTPPCIYSFPT